MMSRLGLALLVLGGCVLALPADADAHAFDPVTVDVRPFELEGGRAEVTLIWTRAIAHERRLDADARALRPGLPEACKQLGAPRRDRIDGAVRYSTRIRCEAPAASIELDLSPLRAGGVDVLLREHRDGDVVHTEIVAGDGRYHLGDRTMPGTRAGFWRVTSSYLAVGIEHILLGWDHLAFVLCLLLLVAGWQRLLWTLTAFTIAHSITLVLSVLDVVTLPGPAVEACIALSILLLAGEIVRRGTSSRAARRPGAMAFAFGLLHGLGFAGALGEVGVPEPELIPALLGFNVGVELGQIMFVVVVLAVMRAGERVARHFDRVAWLPALRSITVYTLGSVAAFWLIERMAGFAG